VRYDSGQMVEVGEVQDSRRDWSRHGWAILTKRRALQCGSSTAPRWGPRQPHRTGDAGCRDHVPYAAPADVPTMYHATG